MIAMLSPAKNMRAVKSPGLALTKPIFRDQTEQLSALMKGYGAWELESLMAINPELALRALMDYQNFSWDGPGSAALLSYYGLAYQRLKAEDFTPEEFDFAQEHVRLLSALYGLLRPADEMMPYRLEYQCKVKPNGKSLYRFWGDAVYRELFREGAPVINLASAEYTKAVAPYLQQGDRFITCDFKVYRRGKLVTLATEAKMARGEMVRFLVKNRLEEPEQLKSFTQNEYAFSEKLSQENNYVFVQGLTV